MQVGGYFCVYKKHISATVVVAEMRIVGVARKALVQERALTTRRACARSVL